MTFFATYLTYIVSHFFLIFKVCPNKLSVMLEVQLIKHFTLSLAKAYVLPDLASLLFLLFYFSFKHRTMSLIRTVYTIPIKNIAERQMLS